MGIPLPSSHPVTGPGRLRHPPQDPEDPLGETPGRAGAFHHHDAQQRLRLDPARAPALEAGGWRWSTMSSPRSLNPGGTQPGPSGRGRTGGHRALVTEGSGWSSVLGDDAPAVRTLGSIRSSGPRRAAGGGRLKSAPIEDQGRPRRAGLGLGLAPVDRQRRCSGRWSVLERDAGRLGLARGGGPLDWTTSPGWYRSRTLLRSVDE